MRAEADCRACLPAASGSLLSSCIAVIVVEKKQLKNQATHTLLELFSLQLHIFPVFLVWFFLFVFISTSNEDRATRLLLHRISCTLQPNKSKLVCGCLRAAVNLGFFSFFSSNFSVFLQRDSAAFSQFLLNHAVSGDFLGADWLAPSPLITES